MRFSHKEHKGRKERIDKMKKLMVVLGCAALVAMVGCVDTDVVERTNKVSAYGKYVMRAVNSAEFRALQKTAGNGGITPWTLTLETDVNIADLRGAPQKTKCSIALRHEKFSEPVVAEFTLCKKPPKPMLYEGMDLGIMQYEWETVNQPLANGWKLEFMVSGTDYPDPQPIAAMLSFGAYMRQNYGTSVFSEGGVLLVVGCYEKDKTLFVDLTRYTARNKPLSGHKQLFKRFVHGEIEESFTPSDDEMNSR